MCAELNVCWNISFLAGNIKFSCLTWCRCILSIYLWDFMKENRCLETKCGTDFDLEIPALISRQLCSQRTLSNDHLKLLVSHWNDYLLLLIRKKNPICPTGRPSSWNWTFAWNKWGLSQINLNDHVSIRTNWNELTAVRATAVCFRD